MEGELIFSATLPVKALSKERPRSAKGGHFYTPPRTRDYERAVKDYAVAMAWGEPTDAFVSIAITIFNAVPKSWPKWRRQLALEHQVYPNKGDLDNKVKAIGDALNGVVYLDDSQIAETFSARLYGDEDRVIIRVNKIGLSPDEIERWRHEQFGGGSA